MKNCNAAFSSTLHNELLRKEDEYEKRENEMGSKDFGMCFTNM